MLIFISGLPGSGKSTIGSIVAQKNNWIFAEADQFLSLEMKAQIKEGQLLSPEQLDDWVLGAVIPHLVTLQEKQHVVAAGLLAEKKFVETLSKRIPDVLYINLDVSYENLKKRVNSRDHFAKEKMLDECWVMREKFILPGPTVDANRPVEEVVKDILRIFNEQKITKQIL